jgi:uncharacterized membrane protein YdjX (TVP38/TMEM64 family)
LEKNSLQDQNDSIDSDFSEAEPETDAKEELGNGTVEGSLASSIQKALVVSLILAGLLALAYFSPFRHYLEKAPEISKQINNMGIWAPIVFVAAVIVLVCIGVPRLILCPIGGMAFGFVWGLIWTQLGTILAYYMIFLFVRWGGREFALQRVPRLGRFSKILKRGGIPAVVLARQIPLYGMLINMLLGLSHISHLDFLLGTAIGILPEAVPFTFIGSSVTESSPMLRVEYIALAVVVLAILWGGLNYHMKVRKLKKLKEQRSIKNN